MTVLFFGPLSDQRKEICIIHAETDDTREVLSQAPKSESHLCGEWTISPVWVNQFAFNIKVVGSEALLFFDAIKKPNPFINKMNQKVWMLERVVHGKD